MKKKCDFYGIVHRYIPIVLLVIGFPFITNVFSLGIKADGHENPPATLPKCEKNGEADISLNFFKLFYDPAVLDKVEKVTMNDYHGTSPIYGLNNIFTDATEYLPADKRSSVTINVSAENCSGALKTELKSKTDFENGFVPTNVLRVGYHAGSSITSVSVKISSVELSPISRRRLIWEKTAPTSFFQNFNPDSKIENPYALVQYSGGGGGSSTCSGNCNNWNNGDVYVDGAIDEEMVWDGDVGCTC